MDTVLIILLIINALLVYLAIRKLKKQIELQQKQIDELCKATGNQNLTEYTLSDEDRAYILHLKHSGKTVEAVKKLREITAMDLLEAKQFVDRL